MPGYLDSFSGIYFGWDEGEDSWGSPTNQSLWQIAYGGVHKTVQGTAQTAPSNPVVGDTYIVGENPSGWPTSPQPIANQLVVYGRTRGAPTTIAWHVLQPRIGWRVFDSSRNVTVEYYNSQWNGVTPTQNLPIVSDNTLSGDGVSTPLSVQFPDQVQADWANTVPTDAGFIRNVPASVRNFVPSEANLPLWSFVNTGRVTNVDITGSTNSDHTTQIAEFDLAPQLISSIPFFNPKFTVSVSFFNRFRTPLSLSTMNNRIRFYLRIPQHVRQGDYRAGTVRTAGYYTRSSFSTSGIWERKIRTLGETQFRLLFELESNETNITYQAVTRAGLAP